MVWSIPSRAKAFITLFVPAIWPVKWFSAITKQRSSAEHYRQLISRDFGLDLTYSAGLAKRLFCGVICFGAVPTRMIEFMKRSPKFCEIMQDLFAGTQPYLELKNRLLRNVNTTVHEILMSFLFRKLILGETRV